MISLMIFCLDDRAAVVEMLIAAITPPLSSRYRGGHRPDPELKFLVKQIPTLITGLLQRSLAQTCLQTKLRVLWLDTATRVRHNLGLVTLRVVGCDRFVSMQVQGEESVIADLTATAKIVERCFCRQSEEPGEVLRHEPIAIRCGSTIQGGMVTGTADPYHCFMPPRSGHTTARCESPR